MFAKAYFRSVPFNLLLLLAALGYLFVMCVLLFIRHRYIGDGYAYNIIPFKTIKSYIVYRNHLNFDTWFKNLFGNIVMFVPIGLFLPLLNRKFMRVLALTAVTIMIITAVELLQMLMRVGSFDIDDIILNTFGALLGLAFIRSLLRLYKPPGDRQARSEQRRGTWQ
jgi:glycopeptide antibiotics resistance protein